MNPPGIANALSVLRVLLAVPLVYCIVQQRELLSSVVLMLAVVSDLVDGPIARHLNSASAAGGLLDHSCDAFFVSCGLLALAYMGWLPALLPVLVVVSFAQYVLDSAALKGRQLRASVLGRWNGIAYYALLVVAVVPQGLGLAALPVQWVHLAAWVLILSTLVSMADRLWAVLAMRWSQ